MGGKGSLLLDRREPSRTGGIVCANFERIFDGSTWGLNAQLNFRDDDRFTTKGQPRLSTTYSNELSPNEWLWVALASFVAMVGAIIVISEETQNASSVLRCACLLGGLKLGSGAPAQPKQVNGRLGHWLQVRVLFQPMTILDTHVVE